MPIHPACRACKGACCEIFVTGFTDPESVEWVKVTRDWPFIHLPCKHLADGQCAIYEERPAVCKKFGVMSDQCLMSVLHRRGEDMVRWMIDAFVDEVADED